MAGLANTGSRARRAAFAMMLAASTAIAGCATDKVRTGSVDRGSAGRPLEQMNSTELAEEARLVGARYARDPQDKATGLRYATALRMNGNNDQALAVMKALAISHPTDRDVLAAYGKALAGAGQLQPALETIRRAQRPDYPDWRLLSAEAAILDQLGNPEAARSLYRRALDIQPNEPSVLSNLGMSYLLTGDLRTAETYMRNAAAQPGADSSVRQNLALVVGLQGRFEEAEQIARQELSPQQAEANVSYLRKILAQQNSWNQLEKEQG